jgi:nitrogen fixation NifU-like protein
MSGYSQTVTELALDPRYAGDLSPCDAIGLTGTPGNGRFLKFTARLSDSRITDIGFTTYGCGPCIAAGSMMAAMVLGQSLPDTAAIRRDYLLAALGGLPDDKLHCADMALAAWQDLLSSVPHLSPRERSERTHSVWPFRVREQAATDHPTTATPTGPSTSV